MCEILAPAGGENSAYAAINSGADAIYLGLDKFSARSSAENFDIEAFGKICGFAHSFNVKVYAALNTVVKDNELDGFFDSLISAWNSGADAVIIQDLFLGKYIKSKYPEIKLHLSTQAGTCNIYGAELAKDFGFDRVILARETKLADIAKISKIIETEVFVQGALCTCFSGQCYMSSFAGGNSGNRGKCKQPCRKRYSIDRNGFSEEAYRLSLSDLSVGESIEEYINAGVASFKIEGRMRRPEYVSAAVTYYKNIIKNRASERDLSNLKRTYNRGNYTKGLSFGQDKSFISSAVQGHIGEFAGIIKVENAKYICQSKLKFNRGDGFKILRGGTEAGGGVFGGEVKGGFILNSRDRLKNGDKVFVTTDTALNEKLLSNKKLLPLDIKAKFNAGEPAVADINGFIYSDGKPLETSKSRPLTKDEIIRCFKKVDGYPFLPECEVQTDSAFMPVSALNSFRRNAYAAYYGYISKTDNSKVSKCTELPVILAEKNTKTAVISTSLNGLKADIGILKPSVYTENLKQQSESFKGEKYLYIPPYMTGEELEKLLNVISGFDGIYCDSYFGFEIAKQLNKPFFAGTGFNITNRISLLNCNAEYVCLSKELTLSEADRLSRNNTFYLSEGNIKVMDLIYCPFEKKCSSCDKRSEYTLSDTEGRKFPLRRYVTSECRFEVFNCADLKAEKGFSGKLTDNTLKTSTNNYTRGHSVSGIN